MSAPTLPVGAPFGLAGERVATASARRVGAIGALTFACDVFAVGLAVVVVTVVAGPPSGVRTPARLGADLAAWAVVVAVLAVRGTYSRARRPIAPRVADQLGPLAVGLVAAGTCLLALDGLLPGPAPFPADQVAAFLGASLVLVASCRATGLFVLTSRDARVARVVVVGTDDVAQGLAGRLARARGVEVVGMVDDEPADGVTVLGTVEELPRICEDRQVDRVVIAFSQRHPARSALILLALGAGVDVDVVTRYYELVGWESRLSDVTGLSLVSIGRPPGRAAGAAKRALDIAVAVALLVLLGPILAVVALAVFVESGGPVLFRQTRVGRDGRPFRILKFRTMRPAPTRGGARSPLDLVADPALVTRVGKLLRRSGIDELPQLFNVLRGEMSVVGPRPFVAEECAGLGGWARRRFDVRPGMTGLWQVCGQHELTFEDLCRLDVQYATSWSLRSDLRILARTPSRLLRGSAPGR